MTNTVVIQQPQVAVNSRGVWSSGIWSCCDDMESCKSSAYVFLTCVYIMWFVYFYVVSCLGWRGGGGVVVKIHFYF